MLAPSIPFFSVDSVCWGWFQDAKPTHGGDGVNGLHGAAWVSSLTLSGSELPRHVRQNSAVLVVVQLFGRIDARANGESLLTARRLRDHGQFGARRCGVVEP